jgi:hypothetical protein
MNIRAFLFSLLLTAAFSLPVWAKNGNPAVLLAPKEQAVKNPYFAQIVRSSGELRDRTEIQYLISRIRESKYKFIRNGQPFAGDKAAKHMAWKYSRSDGRIKTPEQFIDYIASKSIVSGEAYSLQVGDKTYPVRDVLYNELSLLEELRAKKTDTQ